MEIEHDVGLCGGFTAAFDSKVLNLVVGMAEAGSVDESESNAVEYESLFDGVASSAGYGADNGAVIAEEGVEEGGFSSIGTANYGDGDTSFYCVAKTE